MKTYTFSVTNRDKSAKIDMVAVATREDVSLIFETTTSDDVKIGKVTVLEALPFGDVPDESILEDELVDYILDDLHCKHVLEDKIAEYLDDFGLTYYIVSANPNNDLDSWWDHGGQTLWDSLVQCVHVHGSAHKAIVSKREKERIVKRAEKIAGWGIGPEFNEYQLIIQRVEHQDSKEEEKE